MFSDRKSTIILFKEKHLTENPHNIKRCLTLAWLINIVEG